MRLFQTPMIICLLVIMAIFSFKPKDNTINDCEVMEHVFLQKEIMQYLHPELKTRGVLYLEENKYCNINKQLLNNLYIKTVSSKTINKYKNRMYIKKVVKHKNTISKINLFYPIENVDIEVEIIGTEYKITSLEL